MTAAYVDTSALVKLLVLEPESSVLRSHLQQISAVTSVIATLELTAVARRQRIAGGEALVEAIVRRLRLVPLSAAIVAAARHEPTAPPLRALDLLHLATARALRRELGPLPVIAYDLELQEAARADSFAVLAPT